MYKKVERNRYELRSAFFCCVALCLDGLDRDNLYLVRERRYAAQHLEQTAVFVGCKAYGATNLCLLADGVALDAVADIERGIDATSHYGVGVQYAGEFQLDGFWLDLLLFENAVQRQRGTLCGRA